MASPRMDPWDRRRTQPSRRGVVNAGDASHYSRRFATGPYAMRREIEFAVAGTISASDGAIAGFDDVKALPDYPKPTLPDDPTAYPGGPLAS